MLRDLPGRGGSAGGFAGANFDHRLAGGPRAPPLWSNQSPNFTANPSFVNAQGGGTPGGFNRPFTLRRPDRTRGGWCGPRERGDSPGRRDFDAARRLRRPRSPRNGVGGSRSPSPSHEYRSRERDWNTVARKSSQRWGDDVGESPGPADWIAKRGRLKLEEGSAKGSEDAGEQLCWISIAFLCCCFKHTLRTQVEDRGKDPVGTLWLLQEADNLVFGVFAGENGIDALTPRDDLGRGRQPTLPRTPSLVADLQPNYVFSGLQASSSSREKAEAESPDPKSAEKDDNESGRNGSETDEPMELSLPSVLTSTPAKAEPEADVKIQAQHRSFPAPLSTIQHKEGPSLTSPGLERSKREDGGAHNNSEDASTTLQTVGHIHTKIPSTQSVKAQPTEIVVMQSVGRGGEEPNREGERKNEGADDDHGNNNDEEVDSTAQGVDRKAELLRDIDSVDNAISSIKRQIVELNESIQAHAAPGPIVDENMEEAAPPDTDDVEITAETAEEATPEAVLPASTAVPVPGSTTISKRTEEKVTLVTNALSAPSSPKKEKETVEEDSAAPEVAKPSAETVEPVKPPIFGEDINVHTEFLQKLIVDVAKYNRARAAAAERALYHLCHEKPTTLVSKYCYEKSEENPAVKLAVDELERIRPALTDGIDDKLEKEDRRKRELWRKYVFLRHTWLDRLKFRIRSESEEQKRIHLERDQYILMATRGANIVSTPRPGKEPLYKPSPTGGSFGAPSSLREVNIMLNEIETSGGTAGGQERWGRTLASIPEQRPSLQPFDMAPVLIENPMKEYLASRLVNPWTRGERLVFLEKYIIYQKNFR